MVILKLNIINYKNCILDIWLSSWFFVPFRFLGFREVETVWIFVNVGFGFLFSGSDFVFGSWFISPGLVVVSPLIRTVCVLMLSVGVHTAGELKALEKRMESSQLRTRNLTTSDLVKDHLRYLVRPFCPQLPLI